MRKLTEHQINDGNLAIDIEADEPTRGNASHEYTLSVHSAPPAQPHEDWKPALVSVNTLRFQNGAIKETGVNGLTHEALLAVLIDRMRGFQSGPYACRENAVALTKLEEARMWLEERTRKRVARGVEGTHEV